VRRQTTRETREAIRAKLQAEANEMVDELMGWSEKVEEPNLEHIAGAYRRDLAQTAERLSERAAELVIENQGASQPAETPLCPHCREKRRYKGQKERMVESRLGTL
jgi:hypothetical protein